jgi:inorganic pyrophosphatase
MSYPIEFLGNTLTIHIDRPMGSCHPEHGFLYPLNYGYLPEVFSADGEELDAYLLGVFEPVTEYTGVCIAVIHRRDDDDDKLVIAPQGKRYTADQIQVLTEFQERYFQSEILTSPIDST